MSDAVLSIGKEEPVPGGKNIKILHKKKEGITTTQKPK